MKLFPYSYFAESSLRVTKILSRMGVSWTHGLPFQFYPFFNSMKWPYYQKHVNQITLNDIYLLNLALPMLEVFVRILLDVDFSLNQSLPTFLLFVRLSWFLEFLREGYIFRKLQRYLFIFSCGFTSFSVLFLFLPLITFFFVHCCWCDFI